MPCCGSLLMSMLSYVACSDITESSKFYLSCNEIRYKPPFQNVKLVAWISAESVLLLTSSPCLPTLKSVRKGCLGAGFTYSMRWSAGPSWDGQGQKYVPVRGWLSSPCWSPLLACTACGSAQDAWARVLQVLLLCTLCLQPSGFVSVTLCFSLAEFQRKESADIIHLVVIWYLALPLPLI